MKRDHRSVSILSHYIDLSVDNNIFLKLAVLTDDRDIVKTILAHVNPVDDKNSILMSAIKHERFESLELLLDDYRIDPNIPDHEPLRFSIRERHTRVVNILSRHHRVNVSYDQDNAFVKACEYGYLDIVDILLKNGRIDPTANNNLALRSATPNIIARLLDDPRIIGSLSGDELLEFRAMTLLNV
jgi:hypothetical protein